MNKGIYQWKFHIKYKWTWEFSFCFFFFSLLRNILALKLKWNIWSYNNSHLRLGMRKLFWSVILGICHSWFVLLQNMTICELSIFRWNCSLKRDCRKICIENGMVYLWVCTLEYWHLNDPFDWIYLPFQWINHQVTRENFNWIELFSQSNQYKWLSETSRHLENSFEIWLFVCFLGLVHPKSALERVNRSIGSFNTTKWMGLFHSKVCHWCLRKLFYWLIN